MGQDHGLENLEEHFDSVFSKDRSYKADAANLVKSIKPGFEEQAKDDGEKDWRNWPEKGKGGTRSCISSIQDWRR